MWNLGITFQTICFYSKDNSEYICWANMMRFLVAMCQTSPHLWLSARSMSRPLQVSKTFQPFRTFQMTSPHVLVETYESLQTYQIYFWRGQLHCDFASFDFSEKGFRQEDDPPRCTVKWNSSEFCLFKFRCKNATHCTPAHSQNNREGSVQM